MEKALGAYLISTDRARLDLVAIHKYLSEESYWARGRTFDQVARAVKNSLPFGIYRGAAQVGFARVVSDWATFGWLADVYVLADARAHGLGKALVEAVVGHPDVRDLPRLMLATEDAHGFYVRYGFTPLERAERYMAIEPAGYGASR